MTNFVTTPNLDCMSFRSRKTGEVIKKSTTDKIVLFDPLYSNLPTNTDMIKIDPEVQRAKDLGLVKE